MGTVRELLTSLRLLGDAAQSTVVWLANGDRALAPIWQAGHTFQKQCEEEDAAWDAAEALWSRLTAHRTHARCLSTGKKLFDEIGATLVRNRTRLRWESHVTSDESRTRGSGYHLKLAVDVVMNRNHPVFMGDGRTRTLPRDPAFVQAVTPVAPRLRELALTCLKQAREPLDEWRQASTIAHLLAADLAWCAVSLLWWHPPPPPGQGEVERQVSTSVGSPDKTERAAVVAKHDYQRRVGFVRRGRKRGAKLGLPRAKSPKRLAFEAYVRGRRDRGVTPVFIAEDAEALRLYKMSRSNNDGQLTVGIVRRVLREQVDSTN